MKEGESRRGVGHLKFSDNTVCLSVIELVNILECLGSSDICQTFAVTRGDKGTDIQPTPARVEYVVTLTIDVVLTPFCLYSYSKGFFKIS